MLLPGLPALGRKRLSAGLGTNGAPLQEPIPQGNLNLVSRRNISVHGQRRPAAYRFAIQHQSRTLQRDRERKPIVLEQQRMPSVVEAYSTRSAASSRFIRSAERLRSVPPCHRIGSWLSLKSVAAQVMPRGRQDRQSEPSLAIAAVSMSKPR